jgi:hypothetical protein
LDLLIVALQGDQQPPITSRSIIVERHFLLLWHVRF